MTLWPVLKQAVRSCARKTGWHRGPARPLAGAGDRSARQSIRKFWRDFCLGLVISTIGVCSGCGPFMESDTDEQKNPHFIAGKNRQSSMDWQGAVDSFEKALEDNPRSASAHFELGLLYEQRINDYATAMYHYQKHLKLRPESNVAAMARERINACKIELAKSVAFSLVNQQVHAKLTELTTENQSLREQMDRLKTQLSQAAVLSATVPPASNRTPVGEPTPAVGGAPAASVRPAPSTATPAPTPTPGGYRLHTVRKSETMAAIGRLYGGASPITPEEMITANPGVDPRRLKVGQVLRVPVRRN